MVFFFCAFSFFSLLAPFFHIFISWKSSMNPKRTGSGLWTNKGAQSQDDDGIGKTIGQKICLCTTLARNTCFLLDYLRKWILVGFETRCELNQSSRILLGSYVENDKLTTSLCTFTFPKSCAWCSASIPLSLASLTASLTSY